MGTTIVRADVVGSLLRPEHLREAREAARVGTIGADELHAAEDRAVLEAIALQESAGIEAITDGEFRRTGWIAFIPMVDDPLFAAPVSGFEFLLAESGWRNLWKTGAGDPADTSALPPEEPFVTRRLQVERDIVGDEYSFLHANAKARTKYTIPAPSWSRIYWHAELLARRLPHVGRLHRGRRPADPRAHRRPPGRARLRLHPDRRAELRAVAHRPGQPRRVRGARPRHGPRARRGRRARQPRLRGPDRRHARDAHVPRQRALRHVGRDRRLRGDLEGRLPAPDQLRPAPARVRLRPRRRLRPARRRPPPPRGRARARDDEGRRARGPGRDRRARRGGERVRAARSARAQPAVRLCVRRDRAHDDVAEQEAKLHLVGEVARRVWG